MINDFQKIKVAPKKKVIPIHSGDEVVSDDAPLSDIVDAPDVMDTSEDMPDTIVPPAENSVDDDTASSTNLSSPFLPNTKVEKRPLGGSRVTIHPIDEGKQPDEETPADTAEPPVRETIALPHLMPAFPSENHTDDAAAPDGDKDELPERHAYPVVVDDETEHLPPRDETVAVSVPNSFDDQEEKPPVIVDESEETVHPTVAAENELMDMDDSLPARREDVEPASKTPSTVIGSIPPQYKEEPREPIAATSMYDSDAYHQPIAEPPKRMSLLVIILWIIALIVIGVGGGAVYYYLTTMQR